MKMPYCMCEWYSPIAFEETHAYDVEQATVRCYMHSGEIVLKILSKNTLNKPYAHHSKNNKRWEKAHGEVQDSLNSLVAFVKDVLIRTTADSHEPDCITHVVPWKGILCVVWSEKAKCLELQPP